MELISANASVPEGYAESDLNLNIFNQNKTIKPKVYSQIIYRNVWDNIDLIFTGINSDNLEYQFVVKPGGNVSEIKFRQSNSGLLKTHLPVAFQGSKKIDVKTKSESGISGFQVSKYDPKHTLVIDPIVTILTSSATDQAYEVQMASNGDIYVGGAAGLSIDFVGPYNGFGSEQGTDAFIARFDVSLSALTDLTILASTGSDEVLGISFDPANGNVFVSGTTKTPTDFGVSPIVHGTPANGDENGFIAKLSPDLSTLHANAILASTGKDEAHSILVGPTSEVFITGQAGDDGTFGCTGCAQKQFEGDSDGLEEAFITKLSNDLATHIKTVILVSDAEDESYVIDIDATNQIFIAGRTKNYGDFADSKEYYGGQPTVKIGYSAFVIRFDYNLNLQQTGILASEVVSDVIRAMVIDENGSVFVGGLTEDEDTFPKNPKHHYGTSGSIGDPDGFVVKLNNSLSNHSATAIVYSDEKDKVYGLDIDNFGNVIIGGYTEGPNNFGVNPQIDGNIGSEDGFVMKLSNDLGSHMSTDIYSSDYTDIIYEICWGPDQSIVACGETAGTPFLTSSTSVSVLGATGGDADAFVFKIGGTVTDIGGNTETSSSFQIINDQLVVDNLEAQYFGMEIYNLGGQLVQTNSFGFLTKGNHRLDMNISPSASNSILICRLRIGDRIVSKKFFYSSNN